jgi:hypothetical protein
MVDVWPVVPANSASNTSRGFYAVTASMAAKKRRTRAGNVGTMWHPSAKHANLAAPAATRVGSAPIAWTRLNLRGAIRALHAPIATIVETISGQNGTAFNGHHYPTC